MNNIKDQIASPPTGNLFDCMWQQMRNVRSDQLALLVWEQLCYSILRQVHLKYTLK